MLEDIVGDYKDKTVTFEDFPFHDAPVKTASVHPCRHAAVMKLMLDRADAALKIRKAKVKAARKAAGGGASGAAGTAARAADPAKGLVEGTKSLRVADDGGDGEVARSAAAAAARAEGDEWEVLQHGAEGAVDGDDDDDDEPAIRVDQYIVVFLKFIASVTPGIEHDFTMGV